MNQLALVGEVTDRPFRPGNGNRVVVKMKVARGGTSFDWFEFDAFGQAAEFGIKLFVGDLIGVTGRLEDRNYTEHGEQVNELRIVAQFIELLSKASVRRSAGPSSGPSSGAIDDDPSGDDPAGNDPAGDD